MTTLSDSEDEAGDYALLRETVANHGGSVPTPQDQRYVDRQQVSKPMNGHIKKIMYVQYKENCIKIYIKPYSAYIKTITH